MSLYRAGGDAERFRGLGDVEPFPEAQDQDRPLPFAELGEGLEQGYPDCGLPD